MKKVFALSILSIIVLTLPLIAGRKDGLMTEFRAAEEALRSKQTGPDARLRMLETNLLNAVRLSVSRHFYDTNEPGLRLRKEPSSKSDVIGSVRGDLFEIKLTTETSGQWCKVKITK